MNREIQLKAEQLNIGHRKRRLWHKLLTVPACIVVFVTTYAMILPAITLESTPDTYCGYEEHTHFDECYETPGVPEHNEIVCPVQVALHTHTSACFDGNGELICNKADYIVHTHNTFCFDEKGNLICTLPEIKEGHTHTDDCRDANGRLTCGKTVAIHHDHTAECINTVPAIEPEGLICELPEHKHTEECFEQPTAVNAPAKAPLMAAAIDTSKITFTLNDTVAENGHYSTEIAHADGEIDYSRVSVKWYKDGTAVKKKNYVVQGNVVSNLTTNEEYLYKSLDLALDEGSIDDSKTSVTYKAVLCIDGTETNISATVTNTDYNQKILNGSFEKPSLGNYYYRQISTEPSSSDYDSSLKWKTTASDKKIEVVNASSSRNWSSYYGTYRSAKDGTQFAEINCEQDGAIYQSVLTIPGTVMNWKFSHAQRQSKSSARPNGDTMYLFIVPDEDSANYPTTEAIRTKAEELLNGGTEYNDEERGIYIRKLTDKTDWVTYRGQYTIPEGQHVTRFFFVSGNTDDHKEGNFVDDIWFSQELPPAEADTPQFTISKTVKRSDNAQLTTAEQQLLLAQLSFKVIDIATGETLKIFKASEFGNFTETRNSSGGWWNPTYTYSYTLSRAVYIGDYGWDNKTVRVMEDEASASLPGYTVAVTQSNDTMTVLNNASHTFNITNTYTKQVQTVSLSVTKTVVAPDTSGTFDITVFYTGTDGEQIQQTVSLKDGETKTVSGIPSGAQVTVFEGSHDSYTVRMRRGDSVIAYGDNYTFTISENTEITVQNTASALLPETGGVGIIPYLYTGLAVMAVTVIAGYLLRRRYEKEDN